MDADESIVADVIGDFVSDMENADSSMVDSLEIAGPVPKQARKKIKAI